MKLVRIGAVLGLNWVQHVTVFKYDYQSPKQL